MDFLQYIYWYVCSVCLVVSFDVEPSDTEDWLWELNICGFWYPPEVWNQSPADPRDDCVYIIFLKSLKLDSEVRLDLEKSSKIAEFICTFHLASPNPNILYNYN